MPLSSDNVPMPLFIGTKLIHAIPMTRGEYNEYRGWNQPSDEDPEEPGFLVEYVDGGDSNHPNHEGYISWSPEHVFKSAYSSNGNWDFGQALTLLKRGHKLQRKGWNGKGMWIILVPGSTGIRPVAGTPYSNAGLTENVDINEHIDMYTADGAMQPGWLASQADMLAEDWQLAD